MKLEIIKLLYDISEKSKNDTAECNTFQIHFINEVEAFVNKHTFQWREAHEEALKNLGVLGSEIVRLEEKLKKRENVK